MCDEAGGIGKCIEARALLIALPELCTKFDPNKVQKDFTDLFRKRYGVKCVSALHHNKRKTNFHIYLVFSERKMLPEPEIKVDTRSVFSMRRGKGYAPRKKSPERTDRYEKAVPSSKRGRFTKAISLPPKDERFKSEAFLEEDDQVYTAHINRHIANPEQQLKVFDKNGVYLPTKKRQEQSERERNQSGQCHKAGVEQNGGYGTDHRHFGRNNIGD